MLQVYCTLGLALHMICHRGAILQRGHRSVCVLCQWFRFELVLQSTHTSYIQMSMELMNYIIVDIVGPMLTSYFNTGPLILNMLEFAACIVMYIVFLQLDNDSSFFFDIMFL